ncbi:MAG: hypothetical protein JWN40_852 [Phycisphaerales bacterium]|nr:hypothetical protein [Phycisphaerales bacterium]
MYARTLPLVFLASLMLFFMGCAVPVSQPVLSADDPANPLAAESPGPQGSSTLALNDVALPAAAGTDSAMEMQPGMAGMRGMDHSMHGMQHGTPVTRPGANADLSAPRWTPMTMPATSAVIYTCPMHKEVVSSQPGRCPKCGMKLVPKGPATQPAGAGSDKPAGHVHDHGAHE